MSKRCRNLLKKAEKEGRLVVVSIWEHNASKVCSKCLTKTLSNIKIDGSYMHGVLSCSKCRTLWQRDINASRNMANIFYPLVRARIRPKVFCPISKNEDNSTIHSDSGPESRGNDYTCKFFKIKFYLKQTN